MDWYPRDLSEFEPSIAWHASDGLVLILCYPERMILKRRGVLSWFLLN